MIDDVICGTTYVNSGSSTGNAINHLYLRHDIATTGKSNKVDLNFFALVKLCQIGVHPGCPKSARMDPDLRLFISCRVPDW